MGVFARWRRDIHSFPRVEDSRNVVDRNPLLHLADIIDSTSRVFTFIPSTPLRIPHDAKTQPRYPLLCGNRIRVRITLGIVFSDFSLANKTYTLHFSAYTLGAIFLSSDECLVDGVAEVDDPRRISGGIWRVIRFDHEHSGGYRGGPAFYDFEPRSESGVSLGTGLRRNGSTSGIEHSFDE